jgi:hypothetical protein
MPQLGKGRRVAITARLPFDLAGQAAVKAKEKRWSMNQYVNYCVERTLAADRSRDAQQKNEPARV